jgi:hypothetical protein
MLYPTLYLSVLFSLSFVLLLISAYFLSFYRLACMPLAYQTRTEIQNKESYVKCAAVYTFTLVERKSSSLYEQLPWTVNREAETAQTVAFQNNAHEFCDVTDKRRCRQIDR